VALAPDSAASSSPLPHAASAVSASTMPTIKIAALFFLNPCLPTLALRILREIRPLGTRHEHSEN
jgi:hypothetical protein